MKKKLKKLVESRREEMHEHFKKNPVKEFKKKGLISKVLNKFK